MTLDAVAITGGGDLYALRLELANPGSEPLVVETYEPFLAFSIGGATVHRPALDIPVNPTTLEVAPGGTLSLAPPVQLRIAAGADPGDDGFVWTIPADPAGIALTLTLELPAPFDVSSPLTLLHHVE